MTELFITIQDGKIVSGANSLGNAFKSFSGRTRVRIDKAKTRTNPQNKFYWSCILDIQIQAIKDQWGEILSKSEMHDFNKYHYFSKEKITDDGEVIKIPQSSTKKTTVEWEEVIEKIRQDFFTKFGVQIPFPNEQVEINNLCS